jgi:hypothetical protein
MQELPNYPQARVADVRDWFDTCWTSVQEEAHDFSTDLEWIERFGEIITWVKSFADLTPEHVVTLNPEFVGEAEEWAEFMATDEDGA